MLETYREPWVDFLQVASLCRRAGCTADILALVAAKELIDNALDASPAGVAVDVHDRSLVVSDNGSGLSQDQIALIFAVNRPSLSSKRWRLARRGALGNGVRVVMGVAYVSGGSVSVESRGQHVTLTVGLDGGTKISGPLPSEIESGTRVTLTFGPTLGVDAEQIRKYADQCLCAVGTAYGGTKAVPAWFDVAAVRELIRDMPFGTSVLQFARQFDLTPTALDGIKAAALRMTTAELMEDDLLLMDIINRILSGQNGDRSLKRMGRNARDGAYGVNAGRMPLGDARLPCFVEVWLTGVPVLNRKTSGRIRTGAVFANRTPALMARGSGHVPHDSKAFELWLGGTAIEIEGVLKGPCNFHVDIAITAPELPIVSDGKAIDIDVFASLIQDAIAQALPRAYVAPTQKLEREPAQASTSIKDAIYGMIADVYADIASAGIGVPPRMLMYRCRPEILRLTGRDEFEYSTFVNALHDFMDDYPNLTADWQILYDDRGHFIEPGGRRFGLGTQAVDKFIGSISTGIARFDPVIGGFEIKANAGVLVSGNNPADRFAAVVFVEKEGYAELIRNAGIAERFDVAFCSTKGVPNTSVRRLLDTLAEFGTKVFCLHDFDITGLNIAYTLASSNRRYQFQNDLDFVDMGIRLADAEAMGLQSEPFKFDKKTNIEKLRDRLRTYGATDAEIAMFVEQNRRVEIDAMTPRQLVDFIEGKLIDHGIGKIVPDDAAMAAHFQKAVFDIRLDRAMKPLRDEMMRRLEEFAHEQRGNPDLDITVPALQALVEDHLEQNREDTWIEAVATVAAAMETEGRP